MSVNGVGVVSYPSTTPDGLLKSPSQVEEHAAGSQAVRDADRLSACDPTTMMVFQPAIPTNCGNVYNVYPPQSINTKTHSKKHTERTLIAW
jgi:hypothetical protein